MKNVLLHIVTFTTLCCLSTSLPAENDDSGAEMDLDLNGSDCISIRSIRDYTPLDKRTLLIRESGNRVYFVRLMTTTAEIDTGMSLTVHSRDDRLCPYGGDGLIFSSFHPRPVTVRSISRITKEQEEDIKVRYGIKDSDEPQAPEPKQVEGAEVEELG